MSVLCKRNTFGTWPLLLAVDVTPCPYSEVALPSPLSLIPHINNRRTMAGSAFPFRMKHYWTVNACDKGLNVSQSSSFSVFRLFFAKGRNALKNVYHGLSCWVHHVAKWCSTNQWYINTNIYTLHIYTNIPVRQTASKSITIWSALVAYFSKDIKMRISEGNLISLQN